MDSIIKLKDIYVKEWEKGLIEFEVVDEKGDPVEGRVAVKINQKTHFNTEITNGKFSELMNFYNYHNETYDLDVIFGGNNECAPSSEKAKIHIEKTGPILISISDLQNASYRLIKWIETNKRVPGRILINKHEVSIGNLFKLLVTAVNNINKNNSDDIELKWAQTPSVSSETLTDEILLSNEEYIKITDDIMEELNDTKVCPSYVETENGKIGFMNLIYIYSTIISNSSPDNGLLSGVYIKPWKEIVA